MPDFWQTPTVSMGLGPISAIYQARFCKYLEHRGMVPKSDRKIWCFLGDGECDEPESLGAISLAGREGLDNLIFVVNCNLQRLDGPVRGNGKIIQELEGAFRGAGWNVLKLVWGSYWDPLLQRDHNGVLKKLMMETVDGEYQNCKAFGGKYTRDNFFGKYPETAAMVANLADDDIRRLNRGGHDPHKVHAAYAAAVAQKGQPTVILAKTVKGYGMGSAGESLNPTHNTKKLDTEAVKIFRDRFQLPVTDTQIENLSFYHPGEDSPEIQYLKERRAALGGYLPQRRRKTTKVLEAPKLEVFDRLLKSSGEREISTTMAFVQVLNITLRDKQVGPLCVPIVADEARTFGMAGLFRQIGIYSPMGQLYEPEDCGSMLSYRESTDGQLLEEGITEAGALSSWIAAGTSYAVHGLPMLPIYIYYSMFGFQRVGDLIWAAADQRARGFLVGATSGRTTLSGEGLQHQDGSSLLLASTVPTCRAYDPTFAYEVAVIIEHGLRRMLDQRVDEFYYLTVTNENYAHPSMPEGVADGIIKGLYPLASTPVKPEEARVRLLGAGAILREVQAAADLLHQDWGVASAVFSVTSFSVLAREANETERWNRLHPTEAPRRSYVERCLPGALPVVAATDYVRAWPDLIAPFVRGDYTVLGTDGFGRSDTRSALRRFFEVDRQHIAVAALHALAKTGRVAASVVAEAIARYELATDDPAPWLR